MSIRAATRTWLVVSEDDKPLFVRVLRPECEEGLLRIYATNTNSAAEAAAVTALTVHEAPTMLVVDARTTDQALIEETEQYYRSALSIGGAVDHDVVVAQPSVESWLFSNPSVIQAVTGRTLTEADKLRAKYEPRETLATLSGAGNTDPIVHVSGKLTDPQVEQIRNTEEFAKVIKFIHGERDNDSQ